MKRKSLVLLILLGATAIVLLAGACAVVTANDQTAAGRAAEMRARCEANLVDRQD